MKRTWIKLISSLMAAVFLSSSVGVVTRAIELEPRDSVYETINSKVLNHNDSQFKKVKGIDKSNTEDFLHVKTLEEGKNDSPQPAKYKVATEENVDKTYTMRDLNELSYSDMIQVISTIQWNDITDLFQYNDDAQKFYSDSNRIQYIIDSLKERGETFTADDNKGIPTIIEVLRSGFYLSFYNDGLKQINNRQYHDKCIPAIIAIQENPNFKLGTATQDDLIASVGVLVNNASCNAEVVNNFVPILKQYENNIDSFIKDSRKGKAIYNIIDGVQYDINGYVYETGNGTDYSKTLWNNKIDDFLNIMSQWALMGNINGDNEWLINNCIFYMAKIGKVHSNNNEGQRVLTEAMKTYEYLGEQYLQSAFSLSDYYDSKDYYGYSIDIANIKSEATHKYLSKEYKFDDGKVVIKAGDKVAAEKIKKVYWASKEVQAQFFRNLGSDKALEEGNADDVLTMVIYNSPKEYQVNRLLNGLDVNNGGMYIEGSGTFYTYERTTDESIYTLEELFRHEFTHYLQGRYLVPGMWGSGEIYNNSRLTWFEEGGAEFFAGSTRTEGILPRKSVVSNIERRDEQSWYTPTQTMHSQYGGFEFYYYGFALQSYMYNKDETKLYSLMDAIKNNDVSKYDELIKSYSEDKNLENNYKEYLRELVKNYDDLTTPLVSDDYLVNHPNKNAEEVYNDITSVASLQDVKTEINNSQFFKSFKLNGKFNGGKSQGKLNDMKNMDKNLNEFLNTLNGYSWSGYKTVTAYMVDYDVDNDNNVTWTLVFNGILNGDGSETTNKKPVSSVNGPYSGKINENINFTSKGSYDEDGTITEYLWDFGDGNTTKEANPVHKYSKEGIYTVKLTVKDNKGDTDTKETKAKIEKEIVNPDTQYESEPNDSFDKANVYAKANALMVGSLTEGDQDIYCFDVVEDGKVDINLLNYNNIGVNWLVYAENDKDNYIAYPTTSGTELSGSFDAKKGKYYLAVYKYENETAPYAFKINGNIGTKDNVINEKEDNNGFDVANYIKDNTIIDGTLYSNDNDDIYYFDVDNEKEIEVNLENNSNNLGAAWCLYKDGDFDNYISYPEHSEGNSLWTKVTLSPGRYYVDVYRYSGEGGYTLSLK